MTIPSRIDAARILLDLEPPDWLLAHSAAVAEIAAFLADRITARGRPVDVPLAEAAALLHDVDKLEPAAQLSHTLGHGAAGAAWLGGRGHPELAEAVANHPATRLAEPGADAWLASASAEELIVAYADKRATQAVVALDQRFDGWLERYAHRAAAIEQGRVRARQLEARVCALAGVGPHEVVRLPWVAAALAQARATGTSPP